MITRRKLLTLFTAPAVVPLALVLPDRQQDLIQIDGGYLGAERWGITGENGPEIVYGPIAPDENTVRVGFMENGEKTWTWVSPNLPYGGLRKTA